MIIFIVFILRATEAIEWGNTFGGIDAKNVKFECSLNKISMCCEAFDDVNYNETTHHHMSRGIGNDYELKQTKHKDTPINNKHISNHCYINKTYISSEFELININYAILIDQISDPKEREDKFLEIIYSNEYITNSTKWLARIKHHMSTPHIITIPTSDDYVYLSRFEMFIICNGTSTTGTNSNSSAHVGSSGTGEHHPPHTWIEWIEPLTLTARHPFAMTGCKKVKNNSANTNKNKPSIGLCNIDYILLQSGEALNNQLQVLHTQHSPTTHTALRHHTSAGAGASDAHRSKHYMLDLGSSTFTSSLKWFACGYSQVMIRITINRFQPKFLTYFLPLSF